MSDSVEQAASVFESEISGSAPSRGSSGGGKETNKVEALNWGAGELENPEEPAGGDDKPLVVKGKLPKDQDEGDALDGDEGEEPGSDEDEDEGDEKKPKEGDEGDEDEDEETKELMEREFDVVVDGEEVRVPLREALQGYIRQKTFDQRMGQLSEGVKRVTAEAEQVVERRTRAIQLLEEAEAVMKEVMPEEPDWDKLFAEDPQKARQLQKTYQDFHKKVDEVRAKRKQAMEEMAKEQAEQDRDYAENEFKVFASKAKWANKEEMEKDLKSMRRTALEAGMTEEELAQVFASKYLIILRKASKYDRMVANKPKPVKRNGSMPNNPGAGRASTAPKGMNGAQRKLSRTGSVHDAIPVFENILRGR